MKRVVLFQILVIVLTSLVLYIAGLQHKISSFLTGSLVVGGNFILGAVGWKLVFRKKLIALAILIIVFKYAILGVIIYHFVKQSWMQPVWFAAGVTSMMMASLIYGLTLGFFKEEE